MALEVENKYTNVIGKISDIKTQYPNYSDDGTGSTIQKITDVENISSAIKNNSVGKTGLHSSTTDKITDDGYFAGNKNMGDYLDNLGDAFDEFQKIITTFAKGEFFDKFDIDLDFLLANSEATITETEFLNRFDNLFSIGNSIDSLIDSVESKASSFKDLMSEAVTIFAAASNAANMAQDEFERQFERTSQYNELNGNIHNAMKAAKNAKDALPQGSNKSFDLETLKSEVVSQNDYNTQFTSKHNDMKNDYDSLIN